MLLSFPLFSSRISLPALLFFFFFFPLSLLSLFTHSRSAWPRQRRRDFVRERETGRKKRKKTDRKRQWVRVPRWVTGKTRRGSDGLICVSRPFLTLSPELSGGRREVRVDEHFFFFILHNNHQVRQQTHSLPIFSFCPLPDLSNCLASITFFPLPFHFSCLTDVTQTLDR